MKKKVTYAKEYLKGLWEINPVLKQALGLCPALAVTVSAINGIAMALATTFVLLCASVIVSSIRKLIPTQVRIASFIVIIATFVTIVDLVMKAKFPATSKSLGPFIPLIVVNCLILGRQEAFASKNSTGRAALDALGSGSGFLLVLFTLGSIRELIGSGTILNYKIMPGNFEPWLIMILPAGAFLTLGLMLAAANFYVQRKERKEKNMQLESYKMREAELIKAANEKPIEQVEM
jgi:Na+-translocating ferredoxin:NAD+ oxidoreductase subunit E